MKKSLYTCENGIKRMDNEEKFWAWEDDSCANGKIKISVSNSKIVKEDEGLYCVNEFESVEIN